MTKLKLKALLFSMKEYERIRDWSNKNAERFDVEMPSGTAFAPLTSIIHAPEVFNADADGLLITNHRNYTEDQLDSVNRILARINKSLFAVSHGTDPVNLQNNERCNQGARNIQFYNTPILKVLHDCIPVLSFLNKRGPTQIVPQKLEEQTKRLEKLGFIFKRNNKTYCLRKQRLVKVLERESNTLHTKYRFEDLLSPEATTASDFIIRSIA